MTARAARMSRKKPRRRRGACILGQSMDSGIAPPPCSEHSYCYSSCVHQLNRCPRIGSITVPALQRFSSEEPLPKIETPELSIDLERRIVDVRGQRVHLTPPKEFDACALSSFNKASRLRIRGCCKLSGARITARKRRTFAW